MVQSAKALTLDLSELTPSEHALYVEYYCALASDFDRRDLATTGLPDVEYSNVKDFALHRLGVPSVTFDSVFHMLNLPRGTSTLQSGHVLALLRLLAHERRSSLPLTSSLVFTPVQPLALTGTSSSSRRVSLPVRTLGDKNPFRRRHVSQPQTSPGPPPPPTRKASGPPLPPRRGTRTARSGSTSSTNSYLLTSNTAPSQIMRQSLMAVEKAHTQSGSRVTPAVHVIKRSTQPSSSRSTEIIDEVTSALAGVKVEKSFDGMSETYKKQDPKIKVWRNTDILASTSTSDARYAMIIVNQPIRDAHIFRRAWQASKIKVCADGGANRLYDLYKPDSRSKFLPDLIKGDLDSIRPEVRSYYEDRSVPVIQDKDEYSTDLQKCIEEVEKRDAKLPLLLIGGLSGRIDQTIHTISLLHRTRKIRPNCFVLSGESLAWVLDEGSHLIEIDHMTMGQTCGILPVGVDSAQVTTKGLKWNLDWSTSFDGEVSTSNHLLPDEPAVYLKSDRPVLWCVEVQEAST